MWPKASPHFSPNSTRQSSGCSDKRTRRGASKELVCDFCECVTSLSKLLDSFFIATLQARLLLTVTLLSSQLWPPTRSAASRPRKPPRSRPYSTRSLGLSACRRMTIRRQGPGAGAVLAVLLPAEEGVSWTEQAAFLPAVGRGASVGQSLTWSSCMRRWSSILT